MDYFEARYHASAQGRFVSVDPIYFQAGMMTDPQRFNLYSYCRNNPLRLVDPTGEKVKVAGDVEWLRTQVFVDIVGGQEEFDKYFTIYDGQVVLRDSETSRDDLNSGAQLLYDLVTSSHIYEYYAGTDGEEAASLFTFSSDQARRTYINQFTGRGYTSGVGTMIATDGRERQALQPGSVSSANVNADQALCVNVSETPTAQ